MDSLDLEPSAFAPRPLKIVAIGAGYVVFELCHYIAI